MCLIYALIKLKREGGYLLMRRNKEVSFFPHFLHMDTQCTKITHWTRKGVVCRYLTRKKSKAIKEQI